MLGLSVINPDIRSNIISPVLQLASCPSVPCPTQKVSNSPTVPTGTPPRKHQSVTVTNWVSSQQTWRRVEKTIASDIAAMR